MQQLKDQKTKMIAKKALTEFEGFLFAKLDKIGSKSEGPVYFLQSWDEKETELIKKVKPWQEDPVLEPYLNKKVIVFGEKAGGMIDYKKIRGINEPENLLEIDLVLGLKKDVLWVDKMPVPGHFPPELKYLDMSLSVQWPFRSIWHGECPTSKFYDFCIEDAQGRILWQWSRNMIFKNEPEKINIPGGAPNLFKVKWPYFENIFEKEETYTVRARFIATGQKVSRKFDVKFAFKQ